MGTIASALEEGGVGPNPLAADEASQEESSLPRATQHKQAIVKDIEPPPPIPTNRSIDKKAHLLKEIEGGLDALGDRELAAWICHANGTLDKTIVTRGRRELIQRLAACKIPANELPPLLSEVSCPSTISVESLEWFANAAEMRRPPRVNVEYWASAPGAPWRDGFTKQPITKAITIRKELVNKAKAEERDSLTVSTGKHAEKLHGYGISADWLLAFTFSLDLWEWATWEVQLLIVKGATEFRGRCRFAELPEVKPHTGPANVYVSHCWGGKWGDLVAAVTTNCRPGRFLWIDLFAVRQWPGNEADLDFRSVLKLCEGMIVVVPHSTLSCSATCRKHHTLLPFKKGSDGDVDSKKKKKRGLGIRFTNSVIERDTKEGEAELVQKAPPPREDDQEKTGVPACAACGTLDVTLVCRECYFHMCDSCNERHVKKTESEWFLRDEAMVPCYKASEQWSSMIEKQPTCRLWCLVEMQAAIDFGRGIVLKVGTYKLSDLPPEEAELPDVKGKKKKKSARISLALETKKRLPRPFQGKVRFEPPPADKLLTFLLNMSCLVDHGEAAFSLPDDLEREMDLLGDAAHLVDENIATVLTSTAFENSMPQVQCYLLGEKEYLRALPQSKIHAAFESAASGGRTDVMCELLASKPEQVGDLSYHLSKSAMKGRLGSMLFLLNYGADVNAVSYGRTPLTIAVESEQVDAVSLLLSRGARVNADVGGRGTALWWAASKNNPLLVQMLLDAGANPDIASLGQTPLMVAESHPGNASQVIQLLKPNA